MAESKKNSDNFPDFIKRNIFKPITLGILAVVVIGQVLIVLHIHKTKALHHKTLPVANVTLKPLKLDKTKFEIHVVKPHSDMKKKFPKHPEMIIKKMMKVIKKEENKTALLQQEVNSFKKSLGIKDLKDNETTTTKKWSIFKRKRRSIYGRTDNDSDLPMCPETSPLLIGQVSVYEGEIQDSNPTTKQFQNWFGTHLEDGGAYHPRDCKARQKVAIIVPYRDRENHLKVFLHHLHPILQRQLLDYRIFIVEQSKGDEFNRAALMNIGFVEALKMDENFDCFVFHDVDLLPEDDRNLYMCPKGKPKHMSVAVNKWKYRLQYLNYFGGVTALSRDQFLKINGFANSFYGWGGEDDDLFHRIQKQNFTLFRSPANIARFFMLKHEKVDANKDLTKMMEKSRKDLLKEDGLTTLKYIKVAKREFPLYTWILANLPPAPAKEPAGMISNLGSSLWSGVSYFSEGLAKKVSDKAVDYAIKNDEQEEMKKNHIY